MLNKKILEEMKLQRVRLKLSQVEVAAKLGITRNYYSQIENDNSKPPSEALLVKMAALLEFNQDYMLWSFGKMPSDIFDKIMEKPALFEIVRTQYIDL